MKKLLGAVLTIGALAVVGFTGFFILGVVDPDNESNPLTGIIEDAQTSAANTALEASGFKTEIQDTLVENSDSIAAATGMEAEEVTEVITSLDIENWDIAPLPNDAVSAGSFDGSYGGFDGTVTTYEDPSYVTITTMGQNITLSVPQDAQSYVSALQFMQ